MKKTFAVISSLLLILTIVSCGNFNAGKAATTGSIRFSIARDAASTGSTPVSTIAEVTKYDITLASVASDGTATPLSGYPKEYTAAKVAEGIEIPDLTLGDYKISLEAYKGTLLVGKASSGTFTLTADGKTINLSEATIYTAWIYNDTTKSKKIAAGTFSEQFPGTLDTGDLDIPADWIPSGEMLIGWTDGVNNYEPEEVIDIRGKALPYELTAVWGSSTVTCTYNPNYDPSGYFEPEEKPADESKNVARYGELTVPEYQMYMAYKEEIGGLFNDKNYSIEEITDNYGDTLDEVHNLTLWLDSNNWEQYYFCGWSVGTPLPMLKGGTGTDANYEDNKELIKSVKIVQPGEEIALKTDTTLYAVWAREDLSDKILDVRYQWGDGRSNSLWTNMEDPTLPSAMYKYEDGRTNAHIMYLVDNARTDSGTGYENYTIPLKLPVIKDIFPQWNDLPAEFRNNRWGRSYMTEGDTFNYVSSSSSSGNYIIKYPIQIPVLEYHSQGEWFSQNEDLTVIQYEYTFPLPQIIEVRDGEYMEISPQAPRWYGSDSLTDDEIVRDIYQFDYWDVEIGLNGDRVRFSLPGDEIPLNPELLTNIGDDDEVDYSLPLKLYAEWELRESCPLYITNASVDWEAENAHIIYTAEDLDEISDWLDEQYALKLEYEATSSFGFTDFACDIFLAKSIEIDELPEPLGEHFGGRFFGMGNFISVKNGKAPLFREMINGEKKDGYSSIRCLTVKGNFGDYADEWTDENCGVFCNDNVGGRLQDCFFEGTAAGPINGIFGRQHQGLWFTEEGSVYTEYYCDNCKVLSGSDIGNIPLYCPITKTVFLPGATVTQKVGNLVNMTDPHPAFYDIVNGDPDTAVTVDDFYIGETEVTYALWYKVYTWATSLEASKRYTFNTEGRQGSRGVEERRELGTESSSSYSTERDGGEPDEGNLEPVTRVTYQDAMIWCNAASEYEGLKPVYYLQGTTDFSDRSRMVKNATVTNNIALAIADPDANGYRLPTAVEWEFAARGGNPDAEEWNCAYAGSDSLQGYAVHSSLVKEGSTKYTYVEAVKTLLPNSAGLYDMSGNVTEYSYLLSTSTQENKYTHGGGESSVSALLKIDRITDSGLKSSASPINGFRIARSSFN